LNRILPNINSPEDLKGLTWEQLTALAAEIREVITNVVSKNGGHLSSNLGVVELTIALHRTYDLRKDHIIFDVGHQVYTHKILTGRRDSFASIRTDGGLSGFPNPSESQYDTFVEGHAGAALSQALGLVAGSALTGDKGRVIAFVGDGAMTAGMALEALNTSSHIGKRFLVILNDNNMSISKSVGALANHLNKIRVGSTYNELKHDIRAMLQKIPRVGHTMEQVIAEVRDGIRRAIMPGQFFEEMGFAYFGPYDGHDIRLLCETFAEIDGLPLDKPVLVHVVTEKGRGFKPAEDDPAGYHSAAPFVHLNGKVIAPTEGVLPGYTNVFAEALVEAGRNDKRVVAITAAMPDGTGTAEFQKVFPDRFFDVGIAEQHAVGLAAGFARAGLVPVVAIYSTFLQRSYDQIFHEIALQGLPCVFCIDRGGLVGADGPTHHGLLDVAYMRGFPGMVVMAPADAAELRSMVHFAISSGRAVAIRYPRSTVVKSVAAGTLAPVEMGRSIMLREGTDATIIAYGVTASAALDAAATLAFDGIETAVVDARFAKPIDADMVLAAAERGPIITAEEHALAGGFGSAVLELLADRGIQAQITRLGIPDRFVEHGARPRLLASASLDAAGMAAAVKSAVGSRRGAPRAAREAAS